MIRMTDNSLLIAVTEKRTKEEIDFFLKLLEITEGFNN